MTITGVRVFSFSAREIRLINAPQHLILDVVRVFDAFIYLPVGGVAGYHPTQAYDSTQTPATNYFQDVSQVKYVAESSLYVVTTCVGDGFMVRGVVYLLGVISAHACTHWT